MPTMKYKELRICDGERIVAWVFVAPQEFPGAKLSIGRKERPEGGAVIYGDLLCGNAEDGGFMIDVEVNVGDGPDGLLLLNDQYDLSRGRCFVVHSGYEIEQMPHFNGAEARQALP